MESLKIDRSKLISKTEYAKMIGVTPAAIDKQCKAGKLNLVKFNGGELILLD